MISLAVVTDVIEQVKDNLGLGILGVAMIVVVRWSRESSDSSSVNAQQNVDRTREVSNEAVAHWKAIADEAIEALRQERIQHAAERAEWLGRRSPTRDTDDD